MKVRFSRLFARNLQWWNDMLNDLIHSEQHVHSVAEKLHIIAGRAHVLEMEAYGETRPRKTLLPAPLLPDSTTPPECQ